MLYKIMVRGLREQYVPNKLSSIDIHYTLVKNAIFSRAIKQMPNVSQIDILTVAERIARDVIKGKLYLTAEDLYTYTDDSAYINSVLKTALTNGLMILGAEKGRPKKAPIEKEYSLAGKEDFQTVLKTYNLLKPVMEVIENVIEAAGKVRFTPEKILAALGSYYAESLHVDKELGALIIKNKEKPDIYDSEVITSKLTEYITAFFYDPTNVVKQNLKDYKEVYKQMDIRKILKKSLVPVRLQQINDYLSKTVAKDKFTLFFGETSLQQLLDSSLEAFGSKMQLSPQEKSALLADVLKETADILANEDVVAMNANLTKVTLERSAAFSICAQLLGDALSKLAKDKGISEEDVAKNIEGIKNEENKNIAESWVSQNFLATHNMLSKEDADNFRSQFKANPKLVQEQVKDYIELLLTGKSNANLTKMQTAPGSMGKPSAIQKLEDLASGDMGEGRINAPTKVMSNISQMMFSKNGLPGLNMFFTDVKRSAQDKAYSMWWDSTPVFTNKTSMLDPSYSNLMEVPKNEKNKEDYRKRVSIKAEGGNWYNTYTFGFFTSLAHLYVTQLLPTIKKNNKSVDILTQLNQLKSEISANPYNFAAIWPIFNKFILRNDIDISGLKIDTRDLKDSIAEYMQRHISISFGRDMSQSQLDLDDRIKAATLEPFSDQPAPAATKAPGAKKEIEKALKDEKKEEKDRLKPFKEESEEEYSILAEKTEAYRTSLKQSAIKGATAFFENELKAGKGKFDAKKKGDTSLNVFINETVNKLISDPEMIESIKSLPANKETIAHDMHDILLTVAYEIVDKVTEELGFIFHGLRGDEVAVRNLATMIANEMGDPRNISPEDGAPAGGSKEVKESTKVSYPVLEMVLNKTLAGFKGQKFFPEDVYVVLSKGTTDFYENKKKSDKSIGESGIDPKVYLSELAQSLKDMVSKGSTITQGVKSEMKTDKVTDVQEVKDAHNGYIDRIAAIIK